MANNNTNSNNVYTKDSAFRRGGNKDRDDKERAQMEGTVSKGTEIYKKNVPKVQEVTIKKKKKNLPESQKI